MTTSQVPPDVLAEVAAIGLAIDAVVRDSGKSAVARGTFDGVPAAVKYLTVPDQHWAARLDHERRVYQIFAADPPPVRTPRLLHPGNSRLLVLEWVDGAPLAAERYPRAAIGAEQASAVLVGFTALDSWTGLSARLSPIFDYPGRLARYHAAGFLTDDDVAAARRLLRQCAAPGQVSHGDPLASNILLTAHGELVLLDWEFAGLFLPGFDLAMLHTQVGATTPGIRDRIDEMVGLAGIEVPFAVNLAAVLTRELRLHRELPAHDPVRARCLPLIEAAWAAARDRLHRLAAGTADDVGAGRASGLEPGTYAGRRLTVGGASQWRR